MYNEEEGSVTKDEVESRRGLEQDTGDSDDAGENKLYSNGELVDDKTGELECEEVFEADNGGDNETGAAVEAEENPLKELEELLNKEPGVKGL